MKKQSKIEKCLTQERDNYTARAKRNYLLKKAGLYALIATPPILGGILGYYFSPNPNLSHLARMACGAGIGLSFEIPTAMIIGLCSVAYHVGDDWDGL